MSKKAFDSKTAKKLINEYAEKINILTRENQLLKKQLEDAHTSLKLNKDILYTHFSQKVNKDSSQLIIDLQKENTRLSEKVETLYKEKLEATKTIYKLQEELEDDYYIQSVGARQSMCYEFKREIDNQIKQLNEGK